jgi:hypothetical protein
MKRLTFDEYIEQMVTYALTDIEIPGMQLARLRSQVGAMMRQVERDTRHAAYGRIQECANVVNEQRPDRI